MVALCYAMEIVLFVEKVVPAFSIDIQFLMVWQVKRFLILSLFIQILLKLLATVQVLFLMVNCPFQQIKAN